MHSIKNPLFYLAIIVDSWLQRLMIWTPGQVDLIKTAAVTLMVIDHYGLMFHSGNEWLRIVGRGAFPLFGLVWAMNLAKKPQITQSAVNRLWIWALVAQVCWDFSGLWVGQGNILFVFAVSGQILLWLNRYGAKTWPIIIMLLTIWAPFSTASFGLTGSIFLLLSYGLFITTRRITRVVMALGVAISILALNIDCGGVFMTAGLVIPGFTLTIFSQNFRLVPRFWPRDFFPFFYSVHFVVLSLIALCQ